MNKFLYFLFVFIMCGIIRSNGANAKYSIEEFRKWSKLSTDSLMKRGRTYLATETQVDSALICYVIVESRYKDGSGNRHERYQYAKALNNLGYMFAEYYMDFEKAFNYLIASKTVSKSEKFTDNLPYVYMNIAAMYENRRTMFGISTPEQDVLREMKAAFRYAARERQWKVAYTCFSNLLIMVEDDNTLDNIKTEIDVFRLAYKSHPLPMGAYAMSMLKWLEAYNQGDTHTALSHAAQSKALGQKIPDIGMGCELTSLWMRAKTLIKAKKYTASLHCLNDIASFIELHDMEDERVNIYGAYKELYQQMGNREGIQKYDYLYLKEKDRIFHRSNVEKMERSQFVNEINRVNGQMEQIDEKRKSLLVTLSVVLFIVLIVIITLAVIIRGFFRQRAYIKILYQKNMALAKADKQEKLIDRRASRLDESRISDLCEKIDAAMHDTQLICSPDFSLQQLSDSIGSNYKYVSQTINDRYQKNFRMLLNEARVKEACLRLGDPEHYGNLTIEAIAASLGFKSRSNFTVTFKKITGISPSDFQKMAKK